MRRALTFLLPLVMALACGDSSDDPVGLMAPQFAKHDDGGACAVRPDFVVADEANLLAALGAATPGDVIALDGMIELNDQAFVTVAGVTLTCATEGSGLRAAPGSPGPTLLFVLEPDVTVDGLVLDASNVTNAIQAFRTAGPGVNADRFTLRNSVITCGSSSCVFLAGPAGNTIEGNDVVAPWSVFTGVHIQGAGAGLSDGRREFATDGTRVVGNTIRTSAPSITATFGAVRARDGTDIVVSDNVITGPWANGVALANTTTALVDANRIDDPDIHGVLIWFGGRPDEFTRDAVVRRNRIAGAGTAAFFAAEVCGATYVGNAVGRNATAVIFDAVSGDNVFLGPRPRIVDNGALDCDGDGTTDPNAHPANATVIKDANIGQRLRDAAEASSGMN